MFDGTRPTENKEHVGLNFGAIAQVFRGPFLKRIADGTHITPLLEIRRCCALDHLCESDSLRNWLDCLYRLMCRNYRCEYLFKNALANKIFLSRHNIHRSYFTSEIRAGKSRADTVILNGTSSVYEIKSDLDSFERVSKQLADYGKVFDKIFVVTSPKNAEQAFNLVPSHVGVIAMLDDSTLSPLKEPLSNKKNVEPSTIFDCLRQPEYCKIIRSQFGDIPDVPNSRIYRECKDLFCNLSPKVAHDNMVTAVRTRGKKKTFEILIDSAPYSLKHACISFSGSQKQASQITEKLHQPLMT